MFFPFEDPREPCRRSEWPQPFQVGSHCKLRSARHTERHRDVLHCFFSDSAKASQFQGIQRPSLWFPFATVHSGCWRIRCRDRMPKTLVLFCAPATSRAEKCDWGFRHSHGSAGHCLAMAHVACLLSCGMSGFLHDPFEPAKSYVAPNSNSHFSG